MTVQPPWTFREFLEAAVRNADDDVHLAETLMYAAAVWEDFDRMQQREWREYQNLLREWMADHIGKP